MTIIEKEVYGFLENHLCLYDNPHNIQISMDELSISLESHWPGNTKDGEVYIGLWIECETIAEFVTTFGLISVVHMDTITADMLLALYHKGIGEVYCCIDNSLTFYSLYFCKKDNIVQAKNDQDVVHEVPGLLETPEHFKDYTLEHYRLAGMPGYFSPANFS